MLDWDTLVNKESEKILNYIYKIVGEKENARDIIQDTFLACFQNIDRIDEDYILPYLYRTAHNKAINFVKKNKRLVYGEVPEQTFHDTTEEDLKQKKREEIIRNAFRQLKPRYAMVLELQIYHKKSYKEISEITSMSIPTLESILVRAKKKMKKILQEYKDSGVL